MDKQRPVPGLKELRDQVRRSGWEIDTEQAKGLSTYLGLLIRWNRHINLVGLSDWRSILDRLIADSWALAKLLRGLDWPTGIRSLDLGAGAGLPGIPLRLVWQRGEYILVEPRQKRASFLINALSRLELPQTYVQRSRAEALPKGLLPAQLVLSRAFMPWNELLPLAARLLAPNGRMILMASLPANQEMFADQANLVQVQAYPSPGQTRYLWVLDKLTPKPGAKD